MLRFDVISTKTDMRLDAKAVALAEPLYSLDSKSAFWAIDADGNLLLMDEVGAFTVFHKSRYTLRLFLEIGEARHE